MTGHKWIFSVAYIYNAHISHGGQASERRTLNSPRIVGLGRRDYFWRPCRAVRLGHQKVKADTGKSENKSFRHRDSVPGGLVEPRARRDWGVPKILRNSRNEPFNCKCIKDPIIDARNDWTAGGPMRCFKQKILRNRGQHQRRNGPRRGWKCSHTTHNFKIGGGRLRFTKAGTNITHRL